MQNVKDWILKSRWNIPWTIFSVKSSAWDYKDPPSVPFLQYSELHVDQYKDRINESFLHQIISTSSAFSAKWQVARPLWRKSPLTGRTHRLQVTFLKTMIIFKYMAEICATWKHTKCALQVGCHWRTLQQLWRSPRQYQRMSFSGV